MTATTPRPERRPHIPALMGMRFYLAFLIVILHYGWDFKGSDGGVIEIHDGVWRVLRNGQGQWALSIFFVLSGFLLVYNYFESFQRELARFGTFIRTRFARLLPMYLLSLLLITPLVVFAYDEGAAYLGIAEEQQFSQLEMVTGWLANLALVHSFLMPFGGEFYAWNGPSWAISVEVTFYLVFPLFAAHVLGRIRRNRSLLTLALGLYVVEVALVGTMAALSTLVFENPTTAWAVMFFSPVFRVWEFFLGCVLGLFFLRNFREPSTKLGALWHRGDVRNAALALVFLTAFVFAVGDPGRLGIERFWAFARWFAAYTPLALVLVATLAFGRTLLTPLLDNRLVLKLGEASYCLFVLHWIPFYVLLRRTQEGNRPALWVSLLVIGATIVVAVGAYYAIEQPARRFVQRGRLTRAERALAHPATPAL